MTCQRALRWVRIRAKILWLAFRIRQHTRQLRAFTSSLEVYMANDPKRRHNEVDRLLLERARRIQEQVTQMQRAAQAEMRRLAQ